MSGTASILVQLLRTVFAGNDAEAAHFAQPGFQHLLNAGGHAAVHDSARDWNDIRRTIADTRCGRVSQTNAIGVRTEHQIAHILFAFVEEQAAFLVKRATSDSLEATIHRLFMFTLGHKPSAQRLKESFDFVKAREAVSSRDQALTDLVHVLFNSSEFVYIR